MWSGMQPVSIRDGARGAVAKAARDMDRSGLNPKGSNMRNLAQLLKNKRGATAIEYALIASLISVAAIAGYESLGASVQSSYEDIDANLDSAM